MTTIKIRVLHGWEGRGPKDQWPSRPPRGFEDVKFQFGSWGGASDYVFVLNDVRFPTRVRVNPAKVWGFIQEPPSELHTELHIGRPYFAKVYTTDEALIDNKRYMPFWSALIWAVGLSYDELVAAPFPKKTIDLSWITSNLVLLEGHRKRMAFLDRVRNSDVPLTLFGRGFTPVARKWDVLSASRYSISYENYLGGIYWSEKLADCFLSYCTPIYFGARDIEKYFPKHSYVSLDPEDPLLIDRIRDVVQSNFHEEHWSELLEARDLCLHKYNTTFYLASLAKTDASADQPMRDEQRP